MSTKQKVSKWLNTLSLTSHSTNNMSFQTQVFQAVDCTGTNNQSDNNQDKIHTKQQNLTVTHTNQPQLRKNTQKRNLIGLSSPARSANRRVNELSSMSLSRYITSLSLYGDESFWAVALVLTTKLTENQEKIHKKPTVI